MAKAAGDPVLVTMHSLSMVAKGVSSNFTPRRDGPYIKATWSFSSYELADPKTPDVMVGVYHSSASVPYFGNCAELPAPIQPIRKRGRPRKQQTVLVGNEPQVRKRSRPKTNS